MLSQNSSLTTQFIYLSELDLRLEKNRSDLRQDCSFFHDNFSIFFIFESFYLSKIFAFIFDRIHGCKCSGCEVHISPNELVMKALQNVYHVDCFKCFECGDKLEKGDEFILKDNKLYCSADFNVADPKFDSTYFLRYHQHVLILLRSLRMFLIYSCFPYIQHQTNKIGYQ